MSCTLTPAALVLLAAFGITGGLLRAESPTAQQAAPPTRSVWDGVYTTEQAGRGEAIYVKECSDCHGPTLKDGSETPLADEAFREAWQGLSVGDLFERVSKTMPDSDPGKLSGQQDVDVLAHIFRVNQYPAGERELESSPDALKQIRIEPSPQGNAPKPQ